MTPPGHPERVDRIIRLDAVLAGPPYAGIDRQDAPAATDAQIRAAHLPEHVDRIVASVPEEGWTSLDPDTHMCPDSLTAARHAAGSNVAAVDDVLDGTARAVFCAVRPCGHHAERNRAMGFCLFNNVAVGAHHALSRGVGRVAIVDFDVHHGNGTQDIFWDDDRVLFCSSHQMPLYPGTGGAHETGAAGNIVNAPLGAHTGGVEMRAAFERRILPAIDAFEPELLMISAGFDAHENDPLANLMWTAGDFEWVTERLCEAAARHSDGRVVSTLEGGYDLAGLADSTAMHLDALSRHAA